MSEHPTELTSADANTPSTGYVNAAGEVRTAPVPAAELGRGRTAVVLIVSTSAADGRATDTTGPVLVDWLASRGYTCGPPVVAADGAPVTEALASLLTGPEADRPRIIVTSGGTGLNPDDRTPELTAAFLDKEVPGIMHALWAEGLRNTTCAVISRGVAGVNGRTFIVNLPGSRGGVKDGIAVLDPLLSHIQNQIEDVRDHDRQVAGPTSEAD